MGLGPRHEGLAEEFRSIVGAKDLRQRTLILRLLRPATGLAANQVGLPGQGFDCEENAMTVFWADGERDIPRASKQEVARQLLRIMVERRGGAR